MNIFYIMRRDMKIMQIIGHAEAQILFALAAG